MYNIDQLIEQETTIPSMNISSDLRGSLSCTSSMEREERTRSNEENETTPRLLLSSSPYGQETKQLLELMSSNQELNLSRLASEV